MPFRKMWAFIKKDFLLFSSYRLSFILSWTSILLEISIFYFIAKLFGKEASSYLQNYGGEYFPFVLIGIAFSSYFYTSLRSFSRELRQEQMMGTLEAILVSPTSIPLIIISLSLWNFLYTSISVIVYLVFGVAIFGLDLSLANFGLGLVILFLSILSFSALGIISASFILVFKRGDPITWLLGTASALMGGVYFPIAVLPQGLQAISRFLPITYALRAMRHVLLQGFATRDVFLEIAVLLTFCLFLFPASIFIFRYAVKKAKIDGSLVYY